MAGMGFGRFEAFGVGRKTIAKLRHQGFGFATHFEQLRKVFVDSKSDGSLSGLCTSLANLPLYRGKPLRSLAYGRNHFASLHAVRSALTGNLIARVDDYCQRTLAFVVGKVRCERLVGCIDLSPLANTLRGIISMVEITPGCSSMTLHSVA
jgi:hypothetical protein